MKNKYYPCITTACKVISEKVRKKYYALWAYLFLVRLLLRTHLKKYNMKQNTINSDVHARRGRRGRRISIVVPRGGIRL